MARGDLKMTENSWERKISEKKGNNGSFGGDDVGEEREGQSSQRGKLRSTLGGGQLRCLTITNLKVMRQFITRGGEPFHVVVRTSRRSVRRGDVVRDMCGLIWCRRRRGGHRAQSRDDICGRQKKQRQPPPHSFPSTGAPASLEWQAAVICFLSILATLLASVAKGRKGIHS